MKILSLGEIKITRRLLSRLCAQSYDRLGIFMSCITTGLKILTSRSCELASITEMDIDLKEKDADFVKVVKNFLKNLKLVHTILPLPQWICGRGEEIIGIGYLVEENSSDPVSKLFTDPFKQTNTNLFRLGPTCFRTDDEKCVFFRNNEKP